MSDMVQAGRAPITATSATSESESSLPLLGTRTVEFDVTQASWLALDVAPDGRSMVLEILGDLYLLPISGGEAKPLTQGIAMDSQPRFSPDGRQIVFVSDRSGQDNLWLIAVDGSELRRLSKGDSRYEFASPSWAPDGSHVLASRTSWGLRTAELWAYHLEGGKGVRIAKAKAANDTPAHRRANHMGAVYSPDGRYLYYARKEGGFGYRQRLPLWQIARRDLKDDVETLITAAPGSAFRPVLSADGEQLAYITREDQRSVVRLRSLRTGIDQPVSTLAEADEQESRFTRDLFPNYGFGPDGRYLYFSANGMPARVDLATGQQTEIPFSAQIRQQLGPLNRFPQRLGLGPVKARVLSQPALAPDGRSIVFSAFMTVYRYELDSAKLVALSPANVQAFYPTFSPDGRSVAYATWAPTGGHIFRVAANGGQAKRLTAEAAHYTNLTYSNDGRVLVAFRGSAHERLQRERDRGPATDADLVWLPAQGGELSRILPATDLSNPHFADAADRVYFNRNNREHSRSASGGLLSIRLDGTDLREELSVLAPGSYLAEGDVQVSAVTLAPNGRDVLVLHAGQLYLSSRLSPWLRNQELVLTDAQLPAVRLTSVGADSAGFSRDGGGVYWTVGHTLYQRKLSDIAYPRPFTGKEKEPRQPAPGEAIDFESFKALEDVPSVKRWPIAVYRPRSEPKGRYALVGASVISMREGASEPPIIDDGVVLVNGARIEAVGARAEVSIPAGTEQFDISGQYLLPGFIDTHAHYHPLRGALALSSPSLQANLAYGVTTGLDVQPATLDILSYQEAIDAGLMVGPRALSTGPGIFSNHQFDSLESAYHVLRRYRDHYEVRNVKAYIAGDRRQRQWLAQAAQALKLAPTTEGALDMKLDMTHVLDGFAGNEHNFPLQTLYPDLVQLVARSGIGYTPTLLVLFGGPGAEEYFYSRHSPATDLKLQRFTPKSQLDRRLQRRSIWVSDPEQRFAAVAAAARQIVEQGGLVGVGSHGQLQGLGYHWELWALASGGFSAVQALRAATIDGAKMIGVNQDIGSLEPGKLADMVVLASNPLDDLRATTDITRVIKGGVIYDARSLAELWPEQKPPPQRWWQVDKEHSP
ncbi:MAG: amidohydrolase family protein [Pseudomonadales bacterium]